MPTRNVIDSERSGSDSYESFTFGPTKVCSISCFFRFYYNNAKSFYEINFLKIVENMKILIDVLFYFSVLWFSTYSIVIVSMRMYFPDHIPLATAVSAATIFCIHEIMVIIAVLPFLRDVVSSMVGLFFIFPQFVALFALVIWVNTDKSIYDTDIGALFLGVLFWGECIILAGWLFDRALGKEPDFLPAYPHFTGDAVAYLCQ